MPSQAAFVNYHETNDGKTIVSMASRTSCKYQGMGLMDRLKTSTGHLIMDIYPHLAEEVFVTLGSPANDRHLAKMAKELRVLHQWVSYYSKLSPRQSAQSD